MSVNVQGIALYSIHNNTGVVYYDCDYDKLLIISTGCFVIMIVSWATGE